MNERTLYDVEKSNIKNMVSQLMYSVLLREDMMICKDLTYRRKSVWNRTEIHIGPWRNYASPLSGAEHQIGDHKTLSIDYYPLVVPLHENWETVRSCTTYDILRVLTYVFCYNTFTFDSNTDRLKCCEDIALDLYLEMIPRPRGMNRGVYREQVISMLYDHKVINPYKGEDNRNGW